MCRRSTSALSFKTTHSGSIMVCIGSNPVSIEASAAGNRSRSLSKEKSFNLCFFLSQKCIVEPRRKSGLRDDKVKTERDGSTVWEMHIIFV